MNELKLVVISARIEKGADGRATPLLLLLLFCFQRRLNNYFYYSNLEIKN